MQRSYGLWMRRLDLLNGTSLTYKDLCIPCCADCNSKYLSTVEKEISGAIEGGDYNAVSIDHRTWYFWAGKIFYGVLRKELSLLADRTDPTKGTIATARSFLHHCFSRRRHASSVHLHRQFQHHVKGMETGRIRSTPTIPSRRSDQG
jgi:hypothetical protein